MAQQSTDNPAPNPVSPIFIPDYWNLTSSTTTTTTTTTADIPGIVGEIIMVARTTLPSADWLWCNGGAYLAIDYPDLFTAIGYTYGGSGGTFILPQLTGKTSGNQGHMPVGADNPSTMLTVYAGVPKVDGGQRTVNAPFLVSHNHTAGHTHDFSYAWDYPTLATAANQTLVTPGATPYVTTITAGTGNGTANGTTVFESPVDFAGNAVSFLPPFTILNYCIRWKV